MDCHSRHAKQWPHKGVCCSGCHWCGHVGVLVPRARATVVAVSAGPATGRLNTQRVAAPTRSTGAVPQLPGSATRHLDPEGLPTGTVARRWHRAAALTAHRRSCLVVTAATTTPTSRAKESRDLLYGLAAMPLSCRQRLLATPADLQHHAARRRAFAFLMPSHACAFTQGIFGRSPGRAPKACMAHSLPS